MVLDALGDALRNTLRRIAGASHISPELIKELVKDIQRALIQSDVNVRLALELSKTIENRALEEKAPAVFFRVLRKASFNASRTINLSLSSRFLNYCINDFAGINNRIL
jgi:signal recognition particle GTPase